MIHSSTMYLQYSLDICFYSRHQIIPFFVVTCGCSRPWVGFRICIGDLVKHHFEYLTSVIFVSWNKSQHFKKYSMSFKTIWSGVCTIFERCQDVAFSTPPALKAINRYSKHRCTPHEFAATRKQSVQKFHRLLKAC